ncbi:MAG: DUF5103 domain-containing protein [Bacteroidales bacterium]|nr:DUF5103 domain-containing protein [Bacteroidales bacterium]
MRKILVAILVLGFLVSCKTTKKNSDVINNDVENNFSKDDQIKNDDPDDYFVEDRMKYEDLIYIPTIKSVVLHGSDWVFSPPILDFGGEQTLALHFDDLSENTKEFRYTFILCDAEWKPVDLLQMEYLDGFFEEEITDYAYSRNTYQPYIHYKAIIPGNNMKPTRSGNYLLKVWYNENGEEKLAVTRRFYINEHQLGITANVKQGTDIETRNYRQEVDFEINSGSFELINPYQNLHIVVQQNGRYDNAITNLKPRMVKGNIYDYNYESGNSFDATNEFRFFDIKSLSYNSENIAKIDRQDQMYHVYLTNDERRPFQRYESGDDINGRFLIKNDDGSDTDTESEYVWVHFFLKYPNPLSEGSVYIMGSLSDWNFTDANKMEYDFDRGGYADSLLLKQGYYNYLYAFLPNQKNIADDSYIEGRHYEADNDYTIYVYYREPGEIYDRLLGVLSLNSRNN